MAVQVREARTPEEVAAAGRVTLAANAEFVPPGPPGKVWAGYLRSMADTAARAADGTLLVAVDEHGTVVGTVTLYLEPVSEQWRRDDAMFRFLARRPGRPRPRHRAGAVRGLPGAGEGRRQAAHGPAHHRVDGGR